MKKLDINSAITTVRDQIGEAIRARVIGPNADQRTQEIIDAPGERLFTEDRPILRVHSDASMFIGGLRALLLQSLHPLAMAGVAQHSDYRNDPWGRLQRTADFLATTTFGPVDEVEKIIARIKMVHTRVTGFASDGRPYSANDPHLLRWVHVAEVDSFLAAHQRYGAYPLDQKGRDGYVQDVAVIARLLGVANPPESEQELKQQLHDYRPELASTDESRDAAKYLIFEPPLPATARVAYSALVAATIATLPSWTRKPLRLPLLPITEKFALRPLGDAVTRAIRWATVPTSPYKKSQADPATDSHSNLKTNADS